ncbi:hypothetical protein [Jeotgalibaca porci]|uniref:hypothetical protein n=1 Tax=Jeotgalibaca porci TaxID=1868793 RepID=UPI0035A1267A
MKEQLMELIATSVALSFVVSGIVEAIKKNTQIAGIGIIITAILVGVGLLGAMALVFNFPLAESLLLGLLAGLASVGAFEGVKQVKGE